MAKISILPVAERISNIDIDASDGDDHLDEPDMPNCPIRSFANKYIGAIFVIACIIGFFGIFIKRYYMLGITFGVPVIALGAAISPRSSQNDKKLSHSAVILKLLIGEIGLFLLTTCFSLLSSEEGKRPLPPQFFMPSAVVLIGTIVLYFLVAPTIRMKSIFERQKKCTQKVTMYFTGYTRSHLAIGSDDNDNVNIYPQFVYSYKGEKFRITDWEEKIMENGKISSLDIFINPDAPDEFYDKERQKRRIVDSIITLTSTIVLTIVLLLAVAFVKHAGLSAQTYTSYEDEYGLEQEEAETTTENITTEEVVDY